MVKTSNQAIFMLVCFWLGAALHEQETAQSGQFAQSDFQFAFSRPGKKQNDLDFQFAFSRAGKKQNGQEICFFPTREKAIGSLKSNCSCSVARSPT